MIDRPHPWSKGLWRCLIKNVSTVNNYVLIWVDRPTRLLNTWFGFLAFVIILLLRVCLWVNATFCTILRTAPWKLGLAMVVAVLGTISSLGFYLMGGRGDIEDRRHLLCLWMEIKLHFSRFFSCFFTTLWICYRTIKYVLGGCRSLCLLLSFNC